MKISIIAAASLNGVIGKNGGLPWPDIKEDMIRFARITRNHYVIVGRKTHDSILQRRDGEPLADRTTIVITRNPVYGTGPIPMARRVLTAPSFERALALAEYQGEEEVFVIGGAEIYRQAMPVANRFYLTVVYATPTGDTHIDLPKPENGWRMVNLEQPKKEPPEDVFGYVFTTYERTPAEAASKTT